MNPVQNYLVYPAQPKTPPASPAKTNVDGRIETTAKRTLEAKENVSKKRKVYGILRAPRKNLLLSLIQHNDVESFKFKFNRLKPSARIRALSEVVEILGSVSLETRKLFEPIVVTQLLSNLKNVNLTIITKILSKLPNIPEECLELQVIHGNLAHINEHPSEYIHYDAASPSENTLLHLAAASMQFDAFYQLTTLGLNALKVSKNVAPIVLLINAIHRIDAPLNKYDDLFNAIFCSDPWDEEAQLKNIIDAAQFGIFHHCLELVSYAKRRSRMDCKNFKELIPLPEGFDSIGTRALTFPLPQFTSEVTNLKCPRGRNILHWAIALENFDLVEVMAHTPLVTERDAFRQYPLHLASQKHSLPNEVFTSIYKNALFVAFCFDNQDKTPFHYAFEMAFYEYLQILGRHNSPSTSLKDDPLVNALFNSEMDCKQIKLDPEAKKAGGNALHFAAAFAQLKLTQACLRVPGDWFTPDDRGFTPLALTVYKGDFEIFKELIAKMNTNPAYWSQDYNILHIAFEIGRYDYLHHLLSFKLPSEVLNHLNPDGLSLLHICSKYPSHARISDSLLKAGADANVISANQMTPLHSADASHVDLLIRNGADVNHAKNPYQLSPLHVALSQRNFPASDALIKKNADPLLKNIYGETPLEYSKLRPMQKDTIASKILYPHREEEPAIPPDLLVDAIGAYLLGNNHQNPLDCIGKFDRNTVKAAFEKTAKRFPTCNPDEWIDLYYRINEEHFQCIPVMTSSQPLSFSCEDWNAFLKTAPIDEKKKAQLAWWFDVISSRNDYEGVPKALEQKRDFYERLERKLTAILPLLKISNPVKQIEKLNALYDASRRCGTAWLFDTTEVASELNPSLSDVKEEILEITKRLQEHLIKELSLGNVHMFYGILIHLKEIIPSLPHDRPDLDNLAPSVNAILVRNAFFKRYNPTQLIDTLLSALETRKPNLWISWLLSFIPKEESETYIDLIYDMESFKWTRRGAIELLVRSGILQCI